MGNSVENIKINKTVLKKVEVNVLFNLDKIKKVFNPFFNKDKAEKILDF